MSGTRVRQGNRFKAMHVFHVVWITALLAEGIMLLTAYVRTGGVSGGYLLAGAVLPLAVIPILVYLFRASAEGPPEEGRAPIRTIMESAEEGLIAIDGRGVVESLNEAAARMFGYLRSEVEGNHVAMLMPDMGYSPQGSPLAVFSGETGEDTAATKHEVTGRHSGGNTFPLTLSAHKVDLEDKPVFILSLHDRLELEKTEKIKDEFVSTVSHEIRTPLTSILGALGIVSRGMAGEIPEEARKIIDIAHRNCQGLISLVNNILDLSRLESDVHEYRLRPVRLLPVIKQAVEDLQPYAHQFNVGLHLAEGHEGTIVMGREEQLRQVMTNLMSNAIKYSPSGDAVEVSVERTGGRVRVSVKDHGPGVPEEFRARIFQKFAQADSSDSRSRGGTGLGLNISRKIIEKHGGRIGYDSVPWSETAFYFELPEVPEEAPAAVVAFDEATGLMARAGFDRELDKEWRRGGRARSYMSLIFLEVDGLEMYEEMYGADSRADCIKRIAGAITGTLKRAGDVVSRYDDDTFAILLADTDPKGCVFVAEKIRTMINGLGIEFALPRSCGHITVSQGIASDIPKRMTAPDRFVEMARSALLKARAAGGNMVIYDN